MIKVKIAVSKKKKIETCSKEKKIEKLSNKFSSASISPVIRPLICQSTSTVPEGLLCTFLCVVATCGGYISIGPLFVS